MTGFLSTGLLLVVSFGASPPFSIFTLPFLIRLRFFLVVPSASSSALFFSLILSFLSSFIVSSFMRFELALPSLSSLSFLRWALDLRAGRVFSFIESRSIVPFTTILVSSLESLSLKRLLSSSSSSATSLVSAVFLSTFYSFSALLWLAFSALGASSFFIFSSFSDTFFSSALIPFSNSFFS